MKTVRRAIDLTRSTKWTRSSIDLIIYGSTRRQEAVAVTRETRGKTCVHSNISSRCRRRRLIKTYLEYRFDQVRSNDDQWMQAHSLRRIYSLSCSRSPSYCNKCHREYSPSLSPVLIDQQRDDVNKLRYACASNVHSLVSPFLSHSGRENNFIEINQLNKTRHIHRSSSSTSNIWN